MPDLPIQLVVLDMAGTTLKDAGEVEDCFARAIQEENLTASAEWIKSVQGWSKRHAFETLWQDHLGAQHPDLEDRIAHTYARFRAILEDHYLTRPVAPTEGCLETFAWLRRQGIKIVLTTGFYRKVANIILQRLGWLRGLNAQYEAVDGSALIDLSLTSTDVSRGRPAPDMIHAAMDHFGITDPQAVVKVGDTPSDIQAGRSARCRHTIGLTNGTHTHDQLLPHSPSVLLSDLGQLPKFLMGILVVAL